MLRWMVCSLCVLWVTHAQSQVATVEWRSPEFPPFFLEMAAGQYGVMDRLHLEVIAALPDYRHRFRTSNYARLLYDMKQGRQMCSHALIKVPGRTPYVAYSRPVLPMLPPGLVVRAGSEEKLKSFIDANGELSLARVMDESSIRLGFVRGRSYGEEVDRIVRARYAPEGITTRLIASRNSPLLLQMLKAKRVDAVLAYSSEAGHFTHGEGAAEIWGDRGAPDLGFLPLSEQPDYINDYYGCTEGDWGREIIAEVNRVLEREDIQKLAVDLYTGTLLPDSVSHFQTIYQLYRRQEGERGGGPSK
ncbi:hypothetical protein [Marinobacter fonticola]|uniref:hypothetical protein n=1 Tax=Marinobacter fonticola TaxID=2603215 RepID=UPI0011E7016A|nr:hypothetical protein [Marinobacter fonticola]